MTLGRKFRAIPLMTALLFTMTATVGIRTASNPPTAQAWAPYYNANATQGSVYRLYRAYYLREPDQSGFKYWVGQRATGRSLSSISSFFAQSGEFKSRYGSLTNKQFVLLVYKNVMGRAPDAGGYSYWVTKVSKGMSRGKMMLLFSESSEYRAKTALGTPRGYRAGSHAKSMLAALPVVAEERTGYDRALFPHWVDEDRNGCDTRCEVLAAERRPDGTWWSIWDNQIVGSPSGIQIDHVVPLAEAWDSGARFWTTETRRQFANWQTNLIGVSSSSNQSKSDRDAANWQPPNRGSWCVSAEITVTTKFVWELSVDQAEKEALAMMLDGCTSASTPVPPGTATPTTIPSTTSIPPPATTPGCKTAGIYLARNGACVADYERANGDVNCGDMTPAMKPIKVYDPMNDPYRLDADHNGVAC